MGIVSRLQVNLKLVMLAKSRIQYAVAFNGCAHPSEYFTNDPVEAEEFLSELIEGRQARANLARRRTASAVGIGANDSLRSHRSHLTESRRRAKTKVAIAEKERERTQ